MSNDDEMVGEIEMGPMVPIVGPATPAILIRNILERNEEKIDSCPFRPHFWDNKGDRSIVWHLMKRLKDEETSDGCQIGKTAQITLL